MGDSLKKGGRNLGVVQTPSSPPPSDPHLVDHSIYLHRDDEVRIVHWLEGAVHQGLVQVDDYADLV